MAAVAALALVVVFAQPLDSPWWAYADADAMYTVGGLNLLIGEPTRYLDHPGYPLQQVLHVVFGAMWLVSGDARDEWVRQTLLDLDRVRYVFRTLGAAYYVAGALIVAWLTSRLARGAFWALLAGLLWLGAPGLIRMSIQYRPDPLFTALCLVVAYLIVRAAQDRSATRYAVAAFALGATLLVKLHAAALALPLLIAFLVWRPRDRAPAYGRPRLHVVLLATAFVALALALNAAAFPFRPTTAQAIVGLGLVVSLAVSAAFARRGSATATAAFGFGAGVGLPVLLGVRDGLQALVSTAKTLTGGNVNAEISPFSNLERLLERPLREAIVLVAVAGVAAYVGVRRGDPAPVVLFIAAGSMGAMALARLADTHYFAPPYVLAGAAALWLAARYDRAGAVLAAFALAVIVWPQFEDRGSPKHDFDAFVARTQPLLELARDRLAPRELALTPDYYPHADVRWFDVVRPFTPVDDYPYEFVPAIEPALELARERRLRPAYAVDVPAEALTMLGLRSRTIAPRVRTLENDEAAGSENRTGERDDALEHARGTDEGRRE